MFVLDEAGRPYVSSRPGDNWKNDAIQFARLIAEMEAAGLFPAEDAEGEAALLESMDLAQGELTEIIDRAQAVWDDVKTRTPAPGVSG